MANFVRLDIESEPMSNMGSEDGEIYETASQKEKQICPICMDDLPESVNRVNTECGHSFHTSCLMASVASLGFGCPCCRAEMAEEPEYSDEDEDEDEDEWDEDYNVTENNVERDRRERTQRWMVQQNREAAHENAFQGVRNMFLLAEGHEAEDVDDEVEEEEDRPWLTNRLAVADSDDETEVPTEPKPSPQYVMDELFKDGSVSMLNVVKALLLDHDEYENDTEEFAEHSDDIFGKLRIIISNYHPPTVQCDPDRMEAAHISGCNAAGLYDIKLN